jgi:outer membrane receptor protein involved in Fe transport
MHKFILPFELNESVIKKAFAFGSVAALSGLDSNQLMADDSESSNIEEIIVTATKRESKIEDLPMSVQAITGSRLDNAGVSDFMDYAELILTYNTAREDQLSTLEELRMETLVI